MYICQRPELNLSKISETSYLLGDRVVADIYACSTVSHIAAGYCTTIRNIDNTS